ncbi:MAG: ParB/RepB/Spo0J family partition protein [Pseudomonadales bacterium]|nr:ParB/RepB/Spo0J family partition protein [Pseudomonadales bacterium]NIX07007.1 ParB/RepB/Spo0J family partition protein [Pseudomonadales bacterium]
MSKRRLGRGLDALLSSEVVADLGSGEKGPASPEGARIAEIALDELVPNRYQPRRDFNEEALAELVASIKSQGVMQPVVVRPRAQGGYELVAGERRWRAAGLAGLKAIPALVREVSDEQASAMALIENIQREDLNPLEEAHALQRLRDEFGLTQQQVADAVGKSRVAVTNLLRLLNLGPAVRDLLVAGAIEMGHARALLSLDSVAQERAANEVVARQLSVRQTEALARRMQQGAGPARSSDKARDTDTAHLERELSDRIGAPVSISCNAKGRGRLVIRYGSLEELDGILGHIK